MSHTPTGSATLIRSLFGDEDTDDDDDDDDDEYDSYPLNSCDGGDDISGGVASKASLPVQTTATVTETDGDDPNSEGGGGTKKRRRTSSSSSSSPPPPPPPSPMRSTTTSAAAASVATGIDRESSSGNTDGWRKKIGIFDGVLTTDECDELIAVHASEAHGGYIDHMEVTRVVDLLLPGRPAGGERMTVVSSSARPLVLPLVRARYRVWETLEGFFPETGHLGIFPEYTALASWHAGAFLRTHHDSNRDYLRDRHYSALLYLNDPADHPPRAGGGGAGASSADHHRAGDHHPGDYHRHGFSGGDLFFVGPPEEDTASAEAAPPPATAADSSGGRGRRITVRPRAGRLVCFPSTREYLHGVEEITRGVRYALTVWFTRDHDAAESLASLRHEHHRVREAAAGRPEPPPLPLPGQPWETPARAHALRLRVLRAAGIPKPPPPTTGARRQRDPPARQHLAEAALRHLIAHCWWRTGRPLGELLESAVPAPGTDAAPGGGGSVWIVEGGPGFSGLLRAWKDGYLARRARGLASALERWMNRECGLITGVRDDEME